MSVDNGKVCCNCRHCKRIFEEDNSGKFIGCHCDLDNSYLNYVTVMEYWCRHWTKEREVGDKA